METERRKQQKRDGARRSYLKYKTYYRERVKLKRQELTAYVREIKSKSHCSDCGIRYPYYVMDFDHREAENKSALVSRLTQMNSWKRLLSEIEKCDLVCANCHRERTFKRLKSD